MPREGSEVRARACARERACREGELCALVRARCVAVSWCVLWVCVCALCPAVHPAKTPVQSTPIRGWDKRLSGAVRAPRMPLPHPSSPIGKIYVPISALAQVPFVVRANENSDQTSTSSAY